MKCWCAGWGPAGKLSDSLPFLTISTHTGQEGRAGLADGAASVPPRQRTS